MLAERNRAPVGRSLYDKSREVRIGLVLYGGVSLAIYINGVVREFFNAVHGRGVYRLVKALTDSDIVVDIISGTSAGGVNGILLGHALCNGREISGSEKLWRQRGGIADLLRTPSVGGRSEYKSVLDSDYYQDQLSDAFRKLDDVACDPLDDYSPFSELDLFVTGTSVEGRWSTQFDDDGHPIDVLDHRSVFQLKHRGTRKNDLSPDADDDDATYIALGTLARITSCFPGAFEPVIVTVPEGPSATVRNIDQRSPKTADEKLARWGHLDETTCFLDGGILDNKPFTHTIGAIYSRNADARVDRKLYFVEPTPQIAPQGELQVEAPQFGQAVLAGLVGIRSHESIADDLKLIAERNSKVIQYRRLTRSLQPVAALARVVPGEDDQLDPRKELLYNRQRLVALSQRVVDGMLKVDGVAKDMSMVEREIAQSLVTSFDHLAEGMIGAAATWLHEVDVEFRLRRLYRLVYLIYDLLYPEDSDSDPKPTLSLDEGTRKSLQQALRRFNRQIELCEIVRAAMENLLDVLPLPWQDATDERARSELWRTVYQALRVLLDPMEGEKLILPEQCEPEPSGDDDAPLPKDAIPPWPDPDVLEGLDRVLKDRSKRIIANVEAGQAPGSVPDTSLFTVLDGYEAAILKVCEPSRGPVTGAYDAFRVLDAELFPLEMVSNLKEKDVIETVRISPLDAQRAFSGRTPGEKIAGDSLMNFGGFLKRSWRSNDILWGRLDGQCQIIETLLPWEALQRSGEVWKNLFQEDGSLKPSYCPETLFPHSPALHARYEELLHTLFPSSPNSNPTAAELKSAQNAHQDLVNLLVDAAQLEIIAESLPQVRKDAAAEEMEWNSSKRATARDAQGPTDPYLRGLVSDAAGSNELDWILKDDSGAPTTSSSRVKRFAERYEVGSEKIADIPMPVLAETLAKGLLVARDCLLASFGSNADRIRKNPLYFWLLNAPLVVFFALAVLWRRAPGALTGVIAIAIVLSILALAAGVVWFDPILWSGGQPSVTRIIAFGLVPGAVLWLSIRVAIWLAWGLQPGKAKTSPDQLPSRNANVKPERARRSLWTALAFWRSR
jgi:patatin-related protein